MKRKRRSEQTVNLDDGGCMMRGGKPKTKRMKLLEELYCYQFWNDQYSADANSKSQLRQWVQRHESDTKVLELMHERMVMLGRPPRSAKERQKAQHKYKAAEKKRLAAFHPDNPVKPVPEKQLRAPKAPAVREPKLKPEAAQRAAIGLASKKPRYSF